MKLFRGDALWALKKLPDNSIDSLVTDPPAGISFMGKEWDSHKGGRDEWIAWLSEVMREVHRVLKPGAHGFVWAIPRTSHWTATALENAGFEIRDVVTHLFGSGFPKSLDISKAIDKAAKVEREVVGRAVRPDGSTRINTEKKEGTSFSSGSNDKYVTAPATAPATEAAKQWEGFGTALKPASEHWILIRKPISEKTVAANVLKWGVGGLNIDGCRVGIEQRVNQPAGSYLHNSTVNDGRSAEVINAYIEKQKVVPPTVVSGRFPANLVFSHTPYCTDDQCDIECAIKQLDEQSGNVKSAGAYKTEKLDRGFLNTGMFQAGAYKSNKYAGESGGASRFFYCAKVSTKERNEGLDGFELKKRNGDFKQLPQGGIVAGKTKDQHGANPSANTHPTVKAQKLMQYLARLVTPPNGIVLDPFMGSGSTGCAVIKEGFDFIGIEKEKEYFEIAKARINHSSKIKGPKKS